MPTKTPPSSPLRRIVLTLAVLALVTAAQATKLLIPMDGSQRDHLKAYGIAYWTLQRDVPVEWLLNYRGGSFLIENFEAIEHECSVRGVTHQVIADGQAAAGRQETPP